MRYLLDRPFLLLPFFLAAFWAASAIGCRLRLQWRSRLIEGDLEDFKFVVGSTLTLLGLIIGFTFSMAVNRYDLRKNYEEQEANAIGTEFVRADLLPMAEAAKVRALLISYLDERIVKFGETDLLRLPEINARTARLQSELWSSVTGPATAQPTPVNALVLAGMNDVLNSQGYTQAAWWNRIPIEAWVLLTVIAIFCNILIGYGAQGKNTLLLAILPLALSISFSLIADIDSPRGGLIRVRPQNLESLAASLHAE